MQRKNATLRISSISVLLAATLALTLSGCANTGTKEENVAQNATPAVQPPDNKNADSKKVAPAVNTAAAPLSATTDSQTTAPTPSASAKPLESIGAPELRSVYFDFDKYEIRDDFKDPIAAHSKFLVSKKDNKMLLQGNADERGSREYNLALGQRRADAVKRSLLLQGVKEEQIESVSLGEEKPKAPGHDEASWAENRRADMLYRGEY